MQVYRSGLCPGLLYEELMALLKAEIMAQGLMKGGTNFRRATVLTSGITMHAVLSPLLTWHREVWKVVNDVGDLGLFQRSWRQVAMKPPKHHGEVRGPAGALWLAAAALGWSWVSPLVLQAEGGREYVLTKHSPKCLEKVMIQVLSERWLQQGVDRSLLKGLDLTVTPLQDYMRLSSLSNLQGGGGPQNEK